MIEISYVGIDGAGVAHTGRTNVISIAEFVRRRYRAGWRELTVARPSDPDNSVGAIGRDTSTGRRIAWWETAQ